MPPSRDFVEALLSGKAIELKGNSPPLEVLGVDIPLGTVETSCQATRVSDEQRLLLESWLGEEDTDIPEQIILAPAAGYSIDVSYPAFVDEENGTSRSHQVFMNPKIEGTSWKSEKLKEVDEEIVGTVFDYPIEGLGGWLERWREGQAWQSELSHDFMARRRREYSELFELDGPFPLSSRDVVCVDVPYVYGTIGVWVPETHDELVDVIRQFVGALSLGYLRFLGLDREALGS